MCESSRDQLLSSQRLSYISFMIPKSPPFANFLRLSECSSRASSLLNKCNGKLVRSGGETEANVIEVKLTILYTTLYKSLPS